MTATAIKTNAAEGLAPFSLKDAPSFIEAQFPVGRLSAEAYKERKAIIGQTLTALGSYWKGRKPLILARAVVLGALLPATEDPAKNLDIFLKLMAMDDGKIIAHGTARGRPQRSGLMKLAIRPSRSPIGTTAQPISNTLSTGSL